MITPDRREDRYFAIRNETQKALIFTGFQGARFAKSLQPLRNEPKTIEDAPDRAVFLRLMLEQYAFVNIAYRPVRWLRLAVSDNLASENDVEPYLALQEGLSTVRHKREHYDEYIPFAKYEGRLEMRELNGSLADPTASIFDNEDFWLGNRVGLQQIIIAARQTYTNLANSGFWPDWLRLPFDIMGEP